MEFITDKKRRIQQIISMPFIWSLIIPLVIADFWFEFYHRTCFYLYGLKYVKRSDYIRIDRHKLQYLALHEKIGCAYCGYANGLAQYWGRILSDTEKYWCGIMHKKGGAFRPPAHHENFLEYGDEETFNNRYRK